MINAQRIDAHPPAVPAPHGVYAALAEGLHAAAQPLTILLASLAKEHTDSMQAGELRELTAGSAVEVQRVCTLFHYMQQLVSAESIPPDLAATAILPLLRHVGEGVQLLFAQDGMDLRWVLPRACPPLLLDRGRTLDALFNVLLAAHSVSRRNDVIEVALSSNTLHGVHIVVQNPGAWCNLDEIGSKRVELELRLAIAEANVRCQHGVCICSVHPFRVDIDWQQSTPGGGQR